MLGSFACCFEGWTRWMAFFCLPWIPNSFFSRSGTGRCLLDGFLTTGLTFELDTPPLVYEEFCLSLSFLDLSLGFQVSEGSFFLYFCSIHLISSFHSASFWFRSSCFNPLSLDLKFPFVPYFEMFLLFSCPPGVRALSESVFLFEVSFLNSPLEAWESTYSSSSTIDSWWSSSMFVSFSFSDSFFQLMETFLELGLVETSEWREMWLGCKDWPLAFAMLSFCLPNVDFDSFFVATLEASVDF